MKITLISIKFDNLFLVQFNCPVFIFEFYLLLLWIVILCLIVHWLMFLMFATLAAYTFNYSEIVWNKASKDIFRLFHGIIKFSFFSLSFARNWGSIYFWWKHITIFFVSAPRDGWRWIMANDKLSYFLISLFRIVGKFFFLIEWWLNFI